MIPKWPLSFWGKARPSPGSVHAWHPAACHCLDVAAVAEALLRAHPSILTQMAALAGWPEERLARLVVFLVVLHDIGKFSRRFQSFAPEHWPKVLQGAPHAIPGARHDALGYAMLLDDDAILDILLPFFDGWEAADIKLLLGSIAGHHGRPVPEDDIAPGALCPESWNAARSFVSAAAHLLEPSPLPAPAPGAAALLSWWLAGFTTLCDWIGSAEAWFPYRGESVQTLDRYWPDAQSQARRALAESGLLPVAPAALQSLTHLLPFIEQPTPMQALAEGVALPDGPACIIIEDATGGGKTEAALMLAHRLIAAGRADGLFIALPTMATADAMYARLAESYRALFAADANPSLALAHGRAPLNRLFKGSILAAAATAPEEERTDEALPGAAQCAAWLAEERRRVFFAHVGVGTIDQAFLSVLPARHAALRLLGLSGKVLLVDEAHAYDSYMEEELDRLLTFHAMQGGSAIILSATLPQARRARLIGAFARGVGSGPFLPAESFYPLMTIAGRHSAAEHSAEMRLELARSVPVRRLSRMEEAISVLAEAAHAGACCIWVRNTVDDALKGAEALRATGLEPILFHARFAMGDRLTIQGNVLRWFGKKSAAVDRAHGGTGLVLVATQVVEQSLDLDADVMVTDLAPIDLLIQRAGRLQRHPDRKRPPGFETAELLVLSPEPVTLPDEAWAADGAIGGTRFVYAPPILWRSARVLEAAGKILVPEGVRNLVEAVYGPEAEAVPAGLARAEERRLGQATAETGLARINLLEPALGYGFHNGEWAPDTLMPTRLGDDYRTFRMARVENGALVPFCTDVDPAQAWALSEIALRRSLADDAVVPAELAPALDGLRAGWPKWQRGIPVLVMMPEDEGGMRAAGKKKGETFFLSYHSDRGMFT